MQRIGRQPLQPQLKHFHGCQVMATVIRILIPIFYIYTPKAIPAAHISLVLIQLPLTHLTC